MKTIERGLPTRLLLDLSYSYDYCPDCGSPKCPRCGGMMSLRGSESDFSDCEECELIANIRTEECFEVVK